MARALSRIDQLLAITSADASIDASPPKSPKSAHILLCGKGYPLFTEEKQFLESLGHTVTLLPYPNNQTHSLQLLTDHLASSASFPYDGILLSYGQFTKCLPKQIAANQLFPNLRVLSYASSGVPSNDIAFARQNSIQVTNVPSETAHSTADLAVGLCIATARRFTSSAAHWQLRSAEEREKDARANNILGLCDGAKDVHGAKVGIVGFGNIGRQIAKRMSFGFDCKVKYFCGEGKTRKLCDVEYGAEFVASLDALVRDSDFVIASCPLNDSTKGMFCEPVFRAMQSDAVFVNVGRGGLCVTADLVRALREGWIGGAGLDVTDPEPLPREHELWKMDNVTITPHIGTATERCRRRMMKKAVTNLLAVLAESDNEVH